MKLFKKAHYEKMSGLIDEEKEKELEKSAIANAENMGEAKDLWHPDYGWILRGGKVTEAGMRFFERHYPSS